MHATSVLALVLWLASAAAPATAAVDAAPATAAADAAPRREPLFVPDLPALIAARPRILLCRIAGVTGSDGSGDARRSGSLVVEAVIAGAAPPSHLRLDYLATLATPAADAGPDDHAPDGWHRLGFTPDSGDLLLLLIERIASDGRVALTGTRAGPAAIPVEPRAGAATARALAALADLLGTASAPGDLARALAGAEDALSRRQLVAALLDHRADAPQVAGAIHAQAALAFDRDQPLAFRRLLLAGLPRILPHVPARAGLLDTLDGCLEVYRDTADDSVARELALATLLTMVDAVRAHHPLRGRAAAAALDESLARFHPARLPYQQDCRGEGLAAVDNTLRLTELADRLQRSLAP